MSIYFDKKKQLYIVRSYKRGAYQYIGQYDSESDAKAAEEAWKQDYDSEKVEDKVKHTPEWFAATSKRQIKELSEKYKTLRR